MPVEPILFMKDPSTVIGPYDEVLVPRRSVKTDWEVELAIVIGHPAATWTDAEALACIAGYAISNDVSEREFQLERGGQWDKGKSCETFNPLGPWLVPRRRDHRPAERSPAPLGQRRAATKRQDLRHDFRRAARGLLHQPVHGVAARRRHQHRHAGRRRAGQPEPKPFLRAGDVLELEIEGLGRQRQVLGQA